MPTTLSKSAPEGPTASKRRRQVKFPQALDSLQEYCAGLQPGDLVPTHTELMRRFDTSERAVLRALEELQRSGKIVRRRGVGTFVTDRNSITENAQPLFPDAIVDTSTIVAIMRPDHSFYDRCLEVLFRHSKASDLAVACRLVEENSEWSIGQIADARQTAGFIVFTWSLENIAIQLQEAGHRVVVVGTPLPDFTPRVPWVYGDQEQGGFLAVQYLIELGHRRIGFPGFSRLDDGLRGQGHYRAIKTWNSRVEAKAARNGSSETTDSVEPLLISEEVFQAWRREPSLAKAFFDEPDSPTALVMWNDHESLAMMRTLNRVGIDVPGRISIIGYDALPEGSMIHPSITTINPQAEQQIQSALSILARTTPPPSSHAVVVVPSLMLGESTAPPRQ